MLLSLTIFSTTLNRVSVSILKAVRFLSFFLSASLGQVFFYFLVVGSSSTSCNNPVLQKRDQMHNLLLDSRAAPIRG